MILLFFTVVGSYTPLKDKETVEGYMDKALYMDVCQIVTNTTTPELTYFDSENEPKIGIGNF